MARGDGFWGGLAKGVQSGVEMSGRMQDRAQAAEQRKRAIELADLQIGQAKQGVKDREAFDAIAGEVRQWQERFNAPDAGERLKAMQEFSRIHSGSDYGGRTFSKIEGIGADGNIYAYVADPDKGRVMPVNLSDPAMQSRLLNSYASWRMGTVTPQAYRESLDRSVKEAEQARKERQDLRRDERDYALRREQIAATLKAAGMAAGAKTAGQDYYTGKNAREQELHDIAINLDKRAQPLIDKYVALSQQPQTRETVNQMQAIQSAITTMRTKGAAIPLRDDTRRAVTVKTPDGGQMLFDPETQSFISPPDPAAAELAAFKKALGR